MDYIPKFFMLEELLPKQTFEDLERQNKLYVGWWLFDARILKVADLLRERYGKLIANDWAWGGKNQYRGWRPENCPVGALYSQHKAGRAIDLIPLDTTVEKIRRDIKRGENFLYITCIEDRVNWLHVDCRNHKGLLVC